MQWLLFLLLMFAQADGPPSEQTWAKMPDLNPSTHGMIFYGRDFNQIIISGQTWNGIGHVRKDGTILILWTERKGDGFHIGVYSIIHVSENMTFVPHLHGQRGPHERVTLSPKDGNLNGDWENEMISKKIN